MSRGGPCAGSCGLQLPHQMHAPSATIGLQLVYVSLQLVYNWSNCSNLEDQRRLHYYKTKRKKKRKSENFTSNSSSRRIRNIADFGSFLNGMSTDPLSSNSKNQKGLGFRVKETYFPNMPKNSPATFFDQKHCGFLRGASSGIFGKQVSYIVIAGHF